MLKLRCRAKLWRYSASGGWHFVTLPDRLGRQIKASMNHGKQGSPGRQGWGSLRVTAKIGKTSWKTSIFPDRESGSYVMPVKTEVRKREALADGDFVALAFEIPGI